MINKKEVELKDLFDDNGIVNEISDSTLAKFISDGQYTMDELLKISPLSYDEIIFLAIKDEAIEDQLDNILYNALKDDRYTIIAYHIFHSLYISGLNTKMINDAFNKVFKELPFKESFNKFCEFMLCEEYTAYSKEQSLIDDEINKIDENDFMLFTYIRSNGLDAFVDLITPKNYYVVLSLIKNICLSNYICSKETTKKLFLLYFLIPSMYTKQVNGARVPWFYPLTNTPFLIQFLIDNFSDQKDLLVKCLEDGMPDELDNKSNLMSIDEFNKLEKYVMKLSKEVCQQENELIFK